MRSRLWNYGLITLAAGVPCIARSDNFVDAYYDAQSDDLVVTIRYRGKNPDHRFSIQWDRCKTANSGPDLQISAVVLDDQWKDAARAPFTKTTRFSLATVACRPARVTMHTAPHFYYQVDIPASPSLTRR
ncbi:MAG: hypothetical protein ABI831_17550 [Betaproteobacteria bacterium]